MIYVIADTHFNHKKILEFCKRDVDYESKIWKGLFSLKSEDILIHLGDICIGGDLEVHEKIANLNPKKILVRGNHDKKSNNWYLNHGWDFVCETFSNKYHGMNVLFSHKPLPWDGVYDINIHGHLHDLSHRPNEKMHFMNYLISIEKMGCLPISLPYILDNLVLQSNLVDKIKN